jgi:hypothetical protein
MDAQAITGRMLTSLSADKHTMIRHYLLAFGITNAGSDKLPPVFKEKHQPEWEAFTREFELSVPRATKEKIALYRVLEFVRYMKHMGINPFQGAFKHPAEAKIASKGVDPVKVYEKLLESSMFDVARSISRLAHKTHLLLQMKIAKSVSDVKAKNGQYVLTTAFILKPQRKDDTLDGVLTNMRGLLYNDSKVPVQLTERKQALPKTSRAKPKIQNSKAEVLLRSESFMGWYPLSKNDHFVAYLIRAREDLLVFKVKVALDVDVNLGSSTKQTIMRLWTKAFKSI